jgi:MFS family permease
MVEVSTITSVAMMVIVPLSPFFRKLFDRIEKRKIILFIASYTWIVLIPNMMFVSDFLLVLIVGLFGLFASGMPPMTYTITSELVGTKNAGIGFGVLSRTVLASYPGHS